MTPREQAEQLFHTLDDLREEDCEANILNAEKLIITIEKALADARRAGMEEAAIIAEEFSRPYDIDWWFTSTKKEVSAQICRDVAVRIRAKAQAAQEEG